MFCSGPTKKYDQLVNDPNLGNKLLKNTGRSHESAVWTNKICDIYSLIRKSLKIPNDYKIGFVNGSATGAMTSLFWNLLGSKPCNVLETGIFSKRWAHEIFDQLNIPGKIISEEQLNLYNKNSLNNESINHSEKIFNPKYDFVFTVTETAGGFKWFDESILKKISGLKICDATSAVFCEEINWELLDAVGFSFQKALGGEAGLGCIVLSPKAINNIHNKFPTPRFMKIIEKVFDGKIHNTVSLISLNDLYLNLNIFLENGGLEASINQCKKNQKTIMDLASTLQRLPNNNANSALCIRPNENVEWALIKKVAIECEKYGILDIVGHPEYMPCWRFWTGPTINNIEEYIKHFMHIVKNAIQ